MVLCVNARLLVCRPCHSLNQVEIAAALCRSYVILPNAVELGDVQGGLAELVPAGRVQRCCQSI